MIKSVAIIALIASVTAGCCTPQVIKEVEIQEVEVMVPVDYPEPPEIVEIILPIDNMEGISKDEYDKIAKAYANSIVILKNQNQELIAIIDSYRKDEETE